MESQARDVSRLDVEILERLRRGINLLIDELSLNLLLRHDVPPDQLVQPVRDGLEDGARHVDVAAVLDDFLVDELGNLLGGVELRSVEFEGLGRGAIVVEHLLERMTDVGSVDGPVLFLEVVCG